MTAEACILWYMTSQDRAWISNNICRNCVCSLSWMIRHRLHVLFIILAPSFCRREDWCINVNCSSCSRSFPLGSLTKSLVFFYLSTMKKHVCIIEVPVILYLNDGISSFWLKRNKYRFRHGNNVCWQRFNCTF